MVFIKDIISYLEFLRQKKLIHDINAYMRYIKDNNSKINGVHLTFFKLMDKLLEELEQWNISVDALIMDAKNIITLDNFMYQDIIVDNKKKLLKKVILFEKTLSDRFYEGSQSLINSIPKMIYTLDTHLSEYLGEEDYFYNKILLGNFDGVNLCEFLNYVSISIGLAHQKVYYYEHDIKFYCKDVAEDNKVNSLHILDYRKEVHLFFNERLN